MTNRSSLYRICDTITRTEDDSIGISARIIEDLNLSDDRFPRTDTEFMSRWRDSDLEIATEGKNRERNDEAEKSEDPQER